MVGPLRDAGSVHPKSPGKDDREEEEEDARNFQPDDSAHAAKGTQEAAHPACNIPGRLAGSLTGGARLGGVLGRGLAGRGARRGLCAGGHALARHAPGHTQPRAQNPPDGLRFHSVMMVAAMLAQPIF